MIVGTYKEDHVHGMHASVPVHKLIHFSINNAVYVFTITVTKNLLVPAVKSLLKPADGVGPPQHQQHRRWLG